ncbi:L-2-hydroxyglutarate oxidase [Sphingoaurantiacus capsulatus]|uniref:L-2-hydroxyglutarate oxidase n=1 Tax=Sphingoaurantiacus capsulatus TaxID=1771310 RepID=A0ABV7X8K5_9SPHN
MNTAYDYVIVGGGIIGLTTAREILKRAPSTKIAIVDKESRLGLHASGRNSGVLHTGIYYAPGTLKAQFCKAGAEALFDYATERGIDVRRDGKLIIPSSAHTQAGMTALLANAAASGIRAERIGPEEVTAIEPHARSEFGGIFCPDTAVIDSPAVMAALQRELAEQNVVFVLGEGVASIDEAAGRLRTPSNELSFGRLLNSAGAHADSVAKLTGAGGDYRLLPFKGIYYKLTPDAAHLVRASIYPVPDPNLPFLGIHFTRSIKNDVYIGPSAIPALGRENYEGLRGTEPVETALTLMQLGGMYLRNHQGFRRLVHKELPHLTAPGFRASAAKLVRELRPEWISPTKKVGIRPQLVNTRTHRLEMDFIVEDGRRSLHVLNSISPAFTSSFAVAGMLADRLMAN